MSNMNENQPINSKMLRWAREYAGLSIESAAKKAGLKDSRSSTAIQKLKLLENGENIPTTRQILKFAKIYYQPPVVFCFDKPPDSSETNALLNSVTSNITDEERGRLTALVVDIRMRQEMLRSILEDDEDFSNRDFVGSMEMGKNVRQCVMEIKRLLSITGKGNRDRGINTALQLFNDLRRRIENIGVFVILIGDLGSHHSKIPGTVFCGYAIADDFAPLIAINEYDSVETQTFTLIREFVRIIIGISGISSPLSNFGKNTSELQIDRFCDDVAGEFLLPAENLSSFEHTGNTNATMAKIAAIADESLISEPVVAYSLWRNSFIEEFEYRSIRDKFAKQFQEMREKEKENRSKGGPNFFTVRRHRLGKAVLSLVGLTLESEEITHTKAAKILGVNPCSVERLLNG